VDIPTITTSGLTLRAFTPEDAGPGAPPSLRLWCPTQAHPDPPRGIGMGAGWEGTYPTGRAIRESHTAGGAPRAVDLSPSRVFLMFGRTAIQVRPAPCAPIAQLDRASDYGSEGWGFNSSWAY
jgi:hypothetical protein